ncbi:GNAT family N-acetyltransferase [Haploplasma axanthum]|nr:GNAT family N-acetyltransferase [Haploplasma axanthum]
METERLILRPVSHSDINDIFKYFDSKVTKYMYPRPSKTIEEVRTIVDSMILQRESKTDYIYSILKKSTNEFIGLVGLHNLKNVTPEVGLWTKLESHGNHYGREAASRVIQYAKELGYKKLVYPVDKRNIASKKIPLFFNAKVIKEEIKKNRSGDTLDIEVYEIVL